MQNIVLTHRIVVTLFLLIYLVKTVLLLANKTKALAKFSKIFRMPEMIISFLFLATGVYLMFQLPEINKFMIIKLAAVFVSIPIAIIGFKKSNKALASLAMLLIIAAYGLAEMSKNQMAKSENPAAASSVNGEELYSMHCAKCHGTDGKAGIMGSTDLSMSQLDDAALSQMIVNGKSSMPGFGSQLNAEQLSAVEKYVMTLRK